jgi:hypothetical protein
MKIRPVGTELFHADQQTHNEASSPPPLPNFANARQSVHSWNSFGWVVNDVFWPAIKLIFQL